jgi:hypothetical protein
MEKQYAAGRMDAVEATELLETIGLTDSVDQERLLLALDFIRDTGASLPSEPTNGTRSPETDKATDAQLALIAKLVAEKKVVGPDLPITKVQAHEIIDGLKGGTYDAAKWVLPF